MSVLSKHEIREKMDAIMCDVADMVNLDEKWVEETVMRLLNKLAILSGDIEAGFAMHKAIQLGEAANNRKQLRELENNVKGSEQ